MYDRMRRNSSASGETFRLPSLSTSFSNASFYPSQPTAPYQPYSPSFGTPSSSNYPRADATLPPPRSATAVPPSGSFAPPRSSTPKSFSLSRSSGASSSAMSYYGQAPMAQASMANNPAAPRSFTPQFQRRASESYSTLQPSPALVPEKKKLTRARKAAPDCCHVCGAADTPEWRRGPTGLRTLCNGCGLQAKKLFNDKEPQSVPEALSMLQAIGRSRFRAVTWTLPEGAEERAAKTFGNRASAGSKNSSAPSDAFEAALSLEAMSRTAGSPSSSVSSTQSTQSSGAALGNSTSSSNRRFSFGQFKAPSQPPSRPSTPSFAPQQPSSRNRMDLSNLVSPPSRPTSRTERRSSFSFSGSSFKF